MARELFLWWSERTLDWKIWLPTLKELNSSSEICNPIMSYVSLWVYWDISYHATENTIFPLFIREKNYLFICIIQKIHWKCYNPVSKLTFSHSFPSPSFPPLLHPSPPPTAHGTHTVHKYTSTQGEVPPSGFVSDICFGSRFYFKFLLLKEEMHEESHDLRRAYQSKFNWDVES